MCSWEALDGWDRQSRDKKFSETSNELQAVFTAHIYFWVLLLAMIVLHTKSCRTEHTAEKNEPAAWGSEPLINLFFTMYETLCKGSELCFHLFYFLFVHRTLTQWHRSCWSFLVTSGNLPLKTRRLQTGSTVFDWNPSGEKHRSSSHADPSRLWQSKV